MTNPMNAYENSKKVIGIQPCQEVEKKKLFTTQKTSKFVLMMFCGYIPTLCGKFFRDNDNIRRKSSM